jgi:hypothetical protein
MPTGLTLINPAPGADFSPDPGCIHYGEPARSGSEAVNLALLTGACIVALVAPLKLFSWPKVRFPSWVYSPTLAH